MHEPLEIISYKNYKIKVYNDDMPMNPREYVNSSTMVCFHKRYTLGDKHDIKHSDFNSWLEMEGYLIKHYDAIILPVYMYDHSGITIRTYPFSCPWDSGQLGFIFISKEKARKELNKKRLMKKDIEKIEEMLNNEVEYYDKYLRGDFYGFVIESNERNHSDSCWGFDDKEYMINECKSIIDNVKVLLIRRVK
jgi:hypothetical protein